MSLGTRIKLLRKEINLSQDNFAKKIGVHGRQLSRYEVGSSKPSLDILIKIARFCEVSIDYLVFGQDKEVAKRARINDDELLDLLRQTDKLKKAERDKIKWIIKAALNNK